MLAVRARVGSDWRRTDRRLIRWIAGLPTAGALLTFSASARADGIDVAWFLTRARLWREAPLRALGFVVALMAANYALNLIVIGLPARKMGAATARVGWDLVGFTLLAQLCDRVGAVLGVAIGLLAAAILNLEGEGGLGSTVAISLLANFVLSGAAVGLLARHYLKRRWQLAGRWTAVVAVAAAIVTNPAWAIAVSLATAG